MYSCPILLMRINTKTEMPESRAVGSPLSQVLLVPREPHRGLVGSNRNSTTRFHAVMRNAPEDCDCGQDRPVYFRMHRGFQAGKHSCDGSSKRAYSFRRLVLFWFWVLASAPSSRSIASS